MPARLRVPVVVPAVFEISGTVCAALVIVAMFAFAIADIVVLLVWR